MSHTEDRCAHGYHTTLRPARGYPDGYVWPVAEDCPLCAGAPAALGFLPGPPQVGGEQRWHCPRCGTVTTLRLVRPEEPACVACLARLVRA